MSQDPQRHEYERRAEDKRLARIEARLITIEEELKWNVVKRQGPVITQLNELVTKVAAIENHVATKEQIQVALEEQTKEIRTVGRLDFSKKTKLIGVATAIAVVALELFSTLHNIL